MSTNAVITPLASQADLDAAISQIQTALNALVARPSISTITAKIDSIDTKASAINTNVTSVKNAAASQAALNSIWANLNPRITTIDNVVDTINSKATQIKARADLLETNADGGARYNALKGMLTTIDTVADQIKARTDLLETNSSASSRYTGLNNKIQSLIDSPAGGELVYSGASTSAAKLLPSAGIYAVSCVGERSCIYICNGNATSTPKNLNNAVIEAGALEIDSGGTTIFCSYGIIAIYKIS